MESDAAAALPMRTVRERTVLRNVGSLMVLRVLIVLGGIVTAGLVPRTMGPAVYGRYDLITMLTYWFTLLGGLGAAQVISRQTPQLVHEGATDKLRSLFGGLLALRFLSGAVVAVLYLLVIRLWLSDLDVRVLIPLSLVVLVRGPANLCFALFLGQGRILRWALPEAIRQWGSIAFALPCFLLAGLRGAVIGYLVSEIVIVGLGVLGARKLLTRSSLRLALAEFRPQLRLGLVFYVAELLGSAFDRSGGVLVRTVTRDYAQVGMFGVSFQIFSAAVLSSGQLTSSFVPLLTVLRGQGEHAELEIWVERLVKWLTLTAMLGFLGSALVGRTVLPLVLGRAFAPVFFNVVVVAATLLLVPLNHACITLALTHDRPKILIQATSVRIACFWAIGVPLVSRWGSRGACLALFGATCAQSAILLWRSWAVVGRAAHRALSVVGCGIVFLPLAWLHLGPVLTVLVFALAATTFIVVLRALGTISARELRLVSDAIRAAKRRGRLTTEDAP